MGAAGKIFDQGFLNVGDVVRIPPHLEHWHGAEVDQAMTHIAIQEELDGRAADWLEPVQD